MQAFKRAWFVATGQHFSEECCEVQTFPTLSIGTSHDAHASACYRKKERYDCVLVHNVEAYNVPLPWVCLRQIFNFTDSNQQVTEWVLAQPFKLVNPHHPLCYQTGCPYVYLPEEEEDWDAFVVLPAASVKQLVYVIPDFRPAGLGNSWINWWISFGEAKYPDQHRLTLQQQWKWHVNL